MNTVFIGTGGGSAASTGATARLNLAYDRMTKYKTTDIVKNFNRRSKKSPMFSVTAPSALASISVRYVELPEAPALRTIK
jgi:hypothetical protein